MTMHATHPYANRTVKQYREAIVLGLQVAFREDIMDAAGHLSMRIPGTDTFLMNPRFAPAVAEPEDLAIVDVKTGQQLDGPYPIPSEAVIHRAIFNARPDVQSVMHFHSRFLQLVGILDLELRPVLRDDNIFEGGVPILDDANNIDTEELADEMVETLGSARAITLRGHGSIVTGVHPEAATITALQLEGMARSLYEAHLVGRSDFRPYNVDYHSPRRAGVLTQEAHLENPYRVWPFLLTKHNLLSRDRIRALLSSPTYGKP
jgi:L-ribulose-5-phosphate 4-epimerase